MADSHSTEPEAWRPVLGYEDRYEVSDLGRVRSSVRPGDPYLLKSYKNRFGYPCVSVTRVVDGKCKARIRRVHVLVLEAFVGPRPLGLEGAHLDGDPGNPSLSNLKWCTKAENESHKILHGTLLVAARHPQSKLTDEQVEEIRRRGNGHNNYELAAEFGISITRIQYIRRGWYRPAPGVASYDSRAHAAAMGLEKVYNKTERALVDARQHIEKLESFLEGEGYRRCDVAACNCGSWHQHRGVAHG